MGFTGKQVIHPNQVDVAQQAFMPSKEKIEWATGLIEAFKKHQQTGAVSVNLAFYLTFINYPMNLNLNTLGSLHLSRPNDWHAVSFTGRKYHGNCQKGQSKKAIIKEWYLAQMRIFHIQDDQCYAML